MPPPELQIERRSLRNSEHRPLVDSGVAARPELPVNVDRPVTLVLNRAVPSAVAAVARGVGAAEGAAVGDVK